MSLSSLSPQVVARLVQGPGMEPTLSIESVLYLVESTDRQIKHIDSEIQDLTRRITQRVLLRCGRLNPE